MAVFHLVEDGMTMPKIEGSDHIAPSRRDSFMQPPKVVGKRI